MNSYRAAPSQLQAWWAAEKGAKLWFRAEFELATGRSIELVLQQLHDLQEELELLWTRLAVHEELAIPVQQVDESESALPLVLHAISDDPAGFQASLSRHQEAVVQHRAVLAVDFQRDSNKVILTASQTHFDADSLSRLANTLDQGTTFFSDTQFLDFSEWLNQGLREEALASRSFWQERHNLPPLDIPVCGLGSVKVSDTSMTWAEAKDSGWPEKVLASFLAALHERLAGPDRFRLDRLLSYRSLGELENVLGPLKVRVPTKVDMTAANPCAALLEERLNAEQHLAGFDLVSSRDSRPVLLFEVGEPGIESSEIPAVLYLRATLDDARLHLRLSHDCSRINRDFAETLLEATCRRLKGDITPGPLEIAWQNRLGDGGDSDPAVDPILMLQECCESKPEAPAVIAHGQSWTHRQLWARIEHIAASLQAKEVAAGDKVGILLDKSHDAVAAIFGVLYIGGVFVPLDTEWPAKRVNAIIEDSNACLLISNGVLAQRHALHQDRVLLLDDPGRPGQTNLSPPPSMDDTALAYILYTSGSTGRPKGVAVPRLALSRLANAFNSHIYAGQSPERCFTVNAPLSFDASLKQIVMLLKGGKLWLIDEELRRNPPAMLEAMRNDHVDVLDCTPTHLRLLLDAAERESLPLPPTVLVGGENIDNNLWLRIAKRKDSVFINVYGPTEANVVSTLSPVEENLQPGIGRPLPGCRVWIRNSQAQAVATGAIGELWIGGNRIAQGYLNQPELSSAVFIPAPDNTGEIAYRSGDQARWLPDGRLAYCGRQDNQVKLRGHRIELGEIEAALHSHPAVGNAVALPSRASSGELHITAFAEVPLRQAARDNLLPGGQNLAERTRLETDYLYKEIFIDESYAAHGIVLPENGVIFDVGANIGMFSIWAKQRWPSARIHAYEPVPDVAEVCTANLNAFADVALHPYGLSAEPGELEFVHYTNYSMMSGMSEGADSAAEREVIRKQLENQAARGDSSRNEILEHLDEFLDGRFDKNHLKVPVSTLSEELSATGVDEIHLLKIDVQRAELDVLRGLSANDLSKVKQITMEVHDAVNTPTQGRIDVIFEMLEDAGFDVRVDQNEDLAGTDRFTLTAWMPQWRTKIIDSANQGMKCDEEELRLWMDERLPDYARPHHLRILDKLPRTHAGKVDRMQLLEELQFSTTSELTSKPETELEKQLESIWAEVLDMDTVSVTESFFSLGGDSISGIRVQVKAREEGLNFELRDLFECQTIRKLATRTKAGLSSVKQALKPFALLEDSQLERQDPLEDAYPMSGLQQGMLFHSELTGSPLTYHNVTGKRLRAPYEPDAFKRAWSQCLQRHETLRTAFMLTGSSPPLQLVYRQVTAPPSYHDWSHFKPAGVERAREALFHQELNTPFNLERPPLLRLHLCKLPDNQILLIISEHHAILDGLSLELFREELLQRYRDELEGKPQSLGRLACRPAHFLQQERAAMSKSLEPWHAALNDADPIRFCAPTTRQADRKYDLRETEISPALYERLKERAKGLGVHLKHVLLAVHSRVLGEWAANNDVLTGLVLHGRPEQRDSERMLGLFINTLPVRLKVDGQNWDDLILAARDEDRRIQEDRHLPLWVLKRELGRPASVPTFFNYVAFDTPSPGFEVLAEYHVGVDVDVDLAVDFIVNGEGLTLLHQQPLVSSNEADSQALIASTITTLEAAADSANGRLPKIEPAAEKDSKLAVNNQQMESSFVPNEILKVVTGIVSEVLGITESPSDASFRELGGHSLQALEVVYRLRELLETPLPLSALLSAGSLGEFAAMIASPEVEQV